ncbi:LuxR C-terminal-related transcriptional regulator [Streptomyces sp. NPDC053367]|uniref:response regulator transcription factor n=1 Tax=Streptomyces sp. NPDC053367 TaxID=3365700 RepID=UPI0037CD3BD2
MGILGHRSLERSAVRQVLEDDGSLWVVGEGRPEQAPYVVRGSRPDVLVASHEGPEDALRALRAQPGAGPARIVLVGHLSEQATRLLLRHDARGVLLRADTVRHLPWAVRAAAAGSVALAPGPAAFLVDAVVRPGRFAEETAAARTLLKALSRREREILELLAEGESNAAVAARLGISGHTVKDHIRAVYAKLGVRNRIQAARVLWQGQARTQGRARPPDPRTRAQEHPDGREYATATRP